MGKTKRIPLRTCIGCRQVRPKKEMIRIVRTPEGKIEVDPTGKRSGRGAYICPDEKCFEDARKERRFIKALGVDASRDTLEAIVELLKGDSSEV